MTIEEKLQHLQASAMEEARVQANASLQEYEENLEQLFEEFKKEKLAQADISIKAETANVEHTINKALANEQLAVKRKIGKRHSELKSKVFDEVRQLLEDFKKTPAYDTLLLKQIAKAKAFAKDTEFYVYIDPSDAGMQSRLAKESGVDIRISEEIFFGGTRAVIPSRHILIEESFDNKLKEARESFTFSGGTHHE